MRSRLFAALALAAACGGGKPALKTASAPKPPGWLVRVPSSPETVFFSGAKEGAETLEDGKASALESARSQAAQYIGVEISAEHSDVMSTEEAENRAKDTVKSRATAMLRSAEVADTYYERISREVGNGTIDRYDVWVLIRVPRAEVERERERQRAEAKETARAALARLRDGAELEKAGNLGAALGRYRDALSKAKAVLQSTETGDAEIATAGQLGSSAQDALARAQSKWRRALVVAPDWVGGAVAQALGKQGFTATMQDGLDEASALQQAKAQGTPWVIVVHATTTPGGPVFAQVAATAALDARALDAGSGAVVASTQKQARGMGRTPDAARQAAAMEAGVGAGNDLASALVAKESAGL